MRHFKFKKQVNFLNILTPSNLVPSILGPSILAPCLLGFVPLNASAEHLALPSVDVSATRLYDDSSQPLNTGDTAGMLEAHPSVDLYQAGGISALPSIRGLNDDRIKFTVDGASITSACGNHMNPALSYISPGNVSHIDVFAGITPVSMGGDSIAGTINVSSPAPNFAHDTDHLLIDGSASTFYRSNNNGLSANVKASAANQNMSIGFSGGVDRAQSYEDGHGNRVNSTQFDRRYQNVTFGVKGDVQDLTVKIGHQDILYQGYANQRMDMTGNNSDSINVNYKYQFNWGKLDTSIFWQKVTHEMGFFSAEKTGQMPMNTDGKDYGYSIKLDLPLSQTNLLRVGNDYQRQTLDDYWPPVAGSSMMGPRTYININNGTRDRFGVFAEVESKWSQEWSTMLGIRDDYVKMNTGNVQSYGGVGMTGVMMNVADTNAATAFNQRGHAKSDNHVDLTATAKYEGSKTNTVEFGYTRKTRSPSLYERYTWGRGDMAMAMIGWFGDVNGYVGDIDLKPETANTLSATFDWHDANKKDWKFTLTPYYSYIQDYIGANKIGTSGMMLGSRPLLQFTNQDAQIYGVEATWKAALWSGGAFGQGRLVGNLSWTGGEQVNGGQDLYHIMPLQTRLALEQNKGAWENAVELQLVDNKTRVDDVRLEPKTAGYGLVNVRSSYQWKNARFDIAANNLFDKYYELPLGGVNYATWKAAGSTGALGALPGMGRSVNVGLTLNY
ncbi:heme/hemopexin utilization protein C precursor [mine drainage metagenome]|uniref:Heme/hemopexin utilization protein C n=1 Tax=mine drainage metagenome TaxID=410659 RepID=A0A1J5U0F5_9ZZZZ